MMGFSPAPRDFTSYRRMMVFIDGENITMRYQKMVEKGKIPKPTVVHEKDIYVWDPQFTSIVGKHEIIRSTYYTYVVGDENKIDTIAATLKSFNFTKNPNSELTNFLYPCIFRKMRKSRSSKGVDIQMTIDILNHVYSNNIDTVFLISGDGDYLPIINEVIKHGKQIFLAAFSDGFNSILENKADVFLDLDGIAFN